MINTYSFKKVTWIDLESPTKDEVREVMEKFKIHPLAAEDLLLPSPRSKIEQYGEFISLTLHFPAWKQSHKDNTQEIDFVIGKDFLITARYDTIDALYKFSKMFEVNSVLERNGLFGEHAGYMFYYMIREMYRAVQNELDSVKDAMTEIEKKTFTGNEREMVFEISNTSRKLLSLKHTTSLHDDILTEWSEISRSYFGAGYEKCIQSIKTEYHKVSKTISGLSESLKEMRETNDSLLETKQNKIMTTFTMVTIISAFINIMASWFLIESPDSPIHDKPNEFWLAGLLMLTTALVLAGIMKLSKRF